MIDHPNLIPECNVDTAVVEMLGYRRPNHAPSITQVSSILENKMMKRHAIGFIDNDALNIHPHLPNAFASQLISLIQDKTRQ